MSSTTYDAIVIGLGAMGSAALAGAAARGQTVLGIEQYERLHDMGASSGGSRIFRKAYFEAADYVPMLKRADELWRRLEIESGADLFRANGVLLVGNGSRATIRSARESAQTHDIAFEELYPHEIKRRFPKLNPRPDEIGIYEPEAGYIVPETAIDVQLHRAHAAGAEMRFRSRVTGWSDTDSGTLRVRLDDGSTHDTRRLAICMGAWFVPVAREIGIPLVVQRNVQHWFAPASGDYGPLDVPTFLIERDSQPALMYGFPDAGAGVKAALHTWGELTTADELNREVTESDIAPLRDALEAWIPGATHRYLRGKACTYTLTPDEHFVLGKHPFDERIVLAGGFSGHGFKFASVIGEIVSDLLADGATSHDIAFLSPTRFRSAS